MISDILNEYVIPASIYLEIYKVDLYMYILLRYIDTYIHIAAIVLSFQLHIKHTHRYTYVNRLLIIAWILLDLKMFRILIIVINLNDS